MKQKQSLLELFRELEKTQNETARIQAGDVSAYSASGKAALHALNDPDKVRTLNTGIAAAVDAFAAEYLNSSAR